MAFGDNLNKPVRQAAFRSKACVFIDGSNVYATMKALSIKMGKDYMLDWDKIKEYFDDRHDLIRVYYYTALPDREPDKELDIPFKPMIDRMGYNGFCIQTKPMRRFVDPFTGTEKIKGNTDLEMAFDAFDAGAYCNDIYLFTGDGDFCVLVRRLQAMGCRVHVVSTYQTRPAFASDDLRRQADSFLELQDYYQTWRREKE